MLFGRSEPSLIESSMGSNMVVRNMPQNIPLTIRGFFAATLAPAEVQTWQPPIDVYRISGGWFLNFELAGVSPEDMVVYGLFNLSNQAPRPGGRSMQKHRNGRPTHDLVRDASE